MLLRLKPTFADRLRESTEPLVGLWAASGSPVATEIVAGSGADLVLIDAEHGPIDASTALPLLQAVAGHDCTALVRVPWNDAIAMKRFLDIGAQNLIVPTVSSPGEAEAAVRAMRYPPAGVRGIGSALARASQWTRVPDYVPNADAYVSLTVQIETAEAVERAAEIAAVDGVDAIFIGPSDLAGSMGQPGPEVVGAAVLRTIEAVRAAGKPVGVNAFVPADAERYLAAGVDFVVVQADVTVLARGLDAAVSPARGAVRGVRGGVY